jgi:hypothetical protein
MTIFILKTEGIRKERDIIQIRDVQFRLIAYFRLGNPDKELDNCDLSDNKEMILETASKIPYGIIEEIILD